MEKKGLHLGIIPDGSRRWAKKNDIENYDGKQSGDAIEKIVKHVVENHPKVDEISIWALSVDNLKRNESDKELVYNLIENKIETLIEYIEKENIDVKVNIIGSSLFELPRKVKDASGNVENKTKNNKSITLNLCIGYGGKQEITDAVMSASKWLRKNPTMAKIHENVFEKFLMIPRNLDIVIRTGGEKRLSGFMLYQIEYAELFFSDTLWPDFSIKELDDILDQFSNRQRRFGR
ncbi:MAG: di-trans,poly-cis-decaprenylcistransferase [Nanoarchaeota archaeon]|nr:di-trans,poly-cis-decaprenylcistransferase [Nanoarchaeota archaeon]MBU1135637.1 di-trans,poly-cis-decaprenylcistransferase [Nanoarchaeota archaeon]MBU2520002.1 di-trans,poly-cis-decaprenylcistransferase [Nanoarchaeota archaeon]